MSGVAYTTQLPSYKDFETRLAEKKIFSTVQKTGLYSSSSDISQSDFHKQFIVISITNENGLILLEGKLEGVSKYSKFRVVSFSNENFNIYYEDKSTMYNIKIEF